MKKQPENWVDAELNAKAKRIEKQLHWLSKFIETATEEEKKLLLFAWRYRGENRGATAEECVGYAERTLTASGEQEAFA